jgi:pimeloyl-ACP methyl ester carboxylesterase
MPKLDRNGVTIHYEEVGSGRPVLFLHEFAGDHRSWRAQVGALARHYRCIIMAARGYPPSDTPEDPVLYGQQISEDDAFALLDLLGCDRTHVVGLSMGAYTGLKLALRAPDRIAAVVAASGGSGSGAGDRATFLTEAKGLAAHILKAGVVPAEAMWRGPTRIQLFNKDPATWSHEVERLAARPAHAAAYTLEKVQAGRASLRDLESDLARLTAPVLLIAGDEDGACLDINVWLKSVMPSARLAVLPGSGHALNLEEPASFNRLMKDFLAEVDAGHWRPRDPATMPSGGVHSAIGLAGARN